MTIFITGGLGIMGSAVLRRLLTTDAVVVNIDAQTYAALRRRITAFVALPFETLSRLRLQTSVDQIGLDAAHAEKG